MKKILFLAVLSLIPGVGFSNGAALESEVDTELDQLYSGQQQLPEAKVKTKKNATQLLPTQTVTAPVVLTQPSSVSVQQTYSVPAQSLYKQPTTYVEASPLVESRADQMRKSRVEAESSTETKIVEKLEQSRLEDEKRRADVLFGSKFDQLNKSQTQLEQDAINQPQHVTQPAAPVVAPVVPPVQVQVVAPAADTQLQKEEKEVLTRDAIREELKAALKAEEDAPVTPVEQKYFMGLLGFPEYPDATNITGNYSLGAAFGTKYDDTYAVEGSFIMSNFSLNPVYRDGFYAPEMDVTQYSAGLGMKYFLFSGMVRPFLGGLAQYTYRNYNWSNSVSNLYGNEQNTTSQAIDLGLNVGADIVFNPKITVGVDYRYFFNLSSRKNTSSLVYQPYYGTALEQVNSSIISLSAKVQF